MGIYQLNENLSVRLKALQLYIYWDALKGLNYHLVHLCTVMNQTSGGLIIFKNHGKIKYINFSVNLEIKGFFVKFGGTSSIVNKESWLSVVCFLPYCTSAFLAL